MRRCFHLTIPPFIQIAAKTLKSNTSEQEKTLALNIIRDFILAFFYTQRCAKTENRGYSATLPGALSSSVAGEREREYTEVFRLARISNVSSRFHHEEQASRSGTGIIKRTRVLFEGIDAFDIRRMQDEMVGRMDGMTRSMQAAKAV